MTAGNLKIMLHTVFNTNGLQFNTSQLIFPKLERMPDQKPVILAPLRMAQFVIPRAGISD